jgi:lysophospholipase L1-like esterase
MKTFFGTFLSIILLVSSTSYGAKKTKIFIAGDSTAQTYDTTKTVMRGWGQLLPSFFTDGVEVVNYAIGGRSTKSFRDEDRWDKIINQISKGDWIIIQFAHNDTSTGPERHTSPEDFRENLIRFINETHAKKANPLLLTPLVMRTFQEGNLVDNRLKTYPSIIREVAQTYNVPIIDINVKTRDLILLLGDEKSKDLYVLGDDTHTCETGAREVVRFISEGIKNLKLKGLYKQVKL